MSDNAMPNAMPNAMAPANAMPIILSIEGNIGSGKSTLLAKLQEIYVKTR